VDTLVEGSGEIDVYVISGDREDAAAASVPSVRPAVSDLRAYGYAVAMVAAVSAVGWVLFPYLQLANLVMLYLLGVVAIAMRAGRGPSAVAAVLSVAAFDFLFVPPYLNFAVSDTEYLVTFAVMLTVSLVISGLTVRTRTEAERARQRERRTAALYAMSRELANTRGIHELLRVTSRHIAEVFRTRVAMLLPDASGRLRPEDGLGAPFEVDATERGVSQWVFEHGQMAGLGTATLPGASALYLPLVASDRTLGVLGARPTDPRAFETPEQLHQLEAFASQTALALERAILAEEAQQAQVRAETERLRNSLLSSVSHDLRTPLAAITGAASTLLEAEPRLDRPTRRELLETIHEEADRLNRLVQNLLEMTRLESGALKIQAAWHPLEEVVGGALDRLAGGLKDRPVITRLPGALPLVPIDDVLIEQVLINLIDNAVKHTPPESPIEIAAWAGEGVVTVQVADAGPGLAPGEERRIFDKFYRGSTGSRRGVGLGLAICEGIVRAHGGHIWAENRPQGGAAFRFTLPVTGASPPVSPDTAEPDRSHE
jgi:two-component system sensor histidine kinase KdpD